MKKVFFIIIGSVAVFLAGVYLLYQPSTDIFPKPTRINGVDVSGLTVEAAEDKLSEEWRSRDFTFVYQGTEYKIPMSSLSFDLSAETIFSSMSRLEKFKYFFRIENKFDVPMNPEESGEFLTEIGNLPFCDNTGKVKSEDAYVDLSDFEFRVVREKIGTEIDPERVRDIAYKQIAAGEFTAELESKDIIRLPELTADSDEFAERLQYCRDNLSFKIEIEIDGENTVILPEELDEMVTYSEKGPEFNDKRIAKFVDDLAGKVNEYNGYYSFTTHSGREVGVQAVTFGNVLDKNGMISSLEEALTSQKSQQLELKWAQRKFNGGSGIGDSYIECSISEQHVWCYKDGVCVVDCDCVSGAPGHDTAKGVFYIYYVTGPMTLQGTNEDGSRYASPVNCFMPFYGDQGFHGSNGWRSKWGGNIYKTGGSHGCVNCPDAAAKKMANTVCSGYPVVIY